jgi:periplasmic copper chaperone A
MRRRLLAVPVLAVAALALLASAASAHVELEPGEAIAGSEATLTFSFHHGKDGSATTGLDVLMPAGATIVDVPAVPGWTSQVDSVAGRVIWTGTPVPDGTEARFPIVVRLPATPGIAIFKTIQTTEAGELAWIDEAEGDDESVNSAPRLTLVADPNPAATSSTQPVTTSAEAPTTTEGERQAGTTLEAEQRDDGTSSPAPWLIGSGIAAVAAIAIGGTILMRRSG